MNAQERNVECYSLINEVIELLDFPPDQATPIPIFSQVVCASDKLFEALTLLEKPEEKQDA